MTTNLHAAPFRLEPEFNKRIWGKTSLAPWYGDTGTTEAVGEAWLTASECRVAGDGEEAGGGLWAGSFPF